MKAIVLYSRHESGQQTQAQAVASRLGAFAQAVDVLEVYGSDLGRAVKELLRPREFPAIILVQDHLAGESVQPSDVLDALVAEQHDIEDREFRQVGSNHLGALLAATAETGREEIRALVREAVSRKTLTAEKVEELFAARQP